MEINGREFEFIRITISNETKIAKRFKITLRDIIISKYFSHMINKVDWEKTRSIAFKKNFLWKYLGIVPKELRCKNISIEKVGEIQRSFFDYWGGKMKEYRAQLDFVRKSGTENRPPGEKI